MTEVAMCPSCGYTGLTLVEGNRLVCTAGGGCRYEHLVTTTMPIIVITAPEPD
jgi:hypothetical protein